MVSVTILENGCAIPVTSNRSRSARKATQELHRGVTITAPELVATCPFDLITGALSLQNCYSKSNTNKLAEITTMM
jgi:hypothetical protein